MAFDSHNHFIPARLLVAALSSALRRYQGRPTLWAHLFPAQTDEQALATEAKRDAAVSLLESLHITNKGQLYGGRLMDLFQVELDSQGGFVGFSFLPNSSYEPSQYVLAEWATAQDAQCAQHAAGMLVLFFVANILRDLNVTAWRFGRALQRHHFMADAPGCQFAPPAQHLLPSHVRHSLQPGRPTSEECGSPSCRREDFDALLSSPLCFVRRRALREVSRNPR